MYIEILFYVRASGENGNRGTRARFREKRRDKNIIITNNR